MATLYPDDVAKNGGNLSFYTQIQLDADNWISLTHTAASTREKSLAVVVIFYVESSASSGRRFKLARDQTQETGTVGTTYVKRGGIDLAPGEWGYWLLGYASSPAAIFGDDRINLEITDLSDNGDSSNVGVEVLRVSPSLLTKQY